MKQMKPVEQYNHSDVEAKWQKTWKESQSNTPEVSTAARPFYNLMMFPYPSAEGLHVGNMYAFTGTDIYGRFKRMQGYDVLEPIGLDGFGIHSENYAFKVGRHPVEQAKRSQNNFYRQLGMIGAMYDWKRTLETYDPAYYKWTQWLFVQMFKHGLAYRSTAEVNWCPSCKTVLADEQVIEEKCERCGNIVEKRSLEQWFFRITAYAGKLHENIASLDWSEKVKVAQKNWIGKKTGINITYPVVTEDGKEIGEIVCFTTRPDTNFGTTFIVLAPEHPFITQILSVIKNKERDAVTQYVTEAKKKSKVDRISEGRKKTGVFTGVYAINRLNNVEIPLYISDFVVMDVGTGAVVGVPGHDLRDFEFAKAMHLPVIRVVVGSDKDISDIIKSDQVQESEGTMIHSEFLDGMDIHKATEAMMDYLEEKGWGKRVTSYHLRDWIISRQRYWGPPIPMIHCVACAKAHKSWFTTGEAKKMHVTQPDETVLGWYPVPESQLPILLPSIEDYKPGDDGIAPLAKHKEFFETTCPECGGAATRETDVSDTFLDSSWYFLRYPSLQSSTSDTLPFDPEITKKWLPVTMYTGGAEHSVLHLMYSRFVTMALKDWGYLSFEEPFAKFFAHGLVIKDGAKMSKSKGNVVNPDEYIKMYGTDALRLYLMFMGPFSEGGDFRDSAMEGMSRWVGRVWRMAISSLESSTHTMPSDSVRKLLHKTIKKVIEDTDKRRYNTAIASMMEFTNGVSEEGGILPKDTLLVFLRILAPYAPHITEELWQRAGESGSIHTQSTPTYDPAYISDSQVTLIIQVNGKLRDSLQLDREEAGNKDAIEAAARIRAPVQRFLAQGEVKKVIFVPGKLLNFVVV